MPETQTPKRPGPGNANGVKLLQVEPTTNCNFTCGFCCGRRMDQSDISLKAFQTALDKFPGIERLELHGEGEPMMHPGIFEMARLARERGLTVSTITNGSLFTQSNINRILDSGIETLFVSIESARPGEFKEIRGGSLDRVKRGIRRFLAERNRRGLETPTLGFSVTVLKRTQGALPEIADLYRELGMDGGISAHMLNTMPDYVKAYRNDMVDQTLTTGERALAWARYARIIESPVFRRTKVHFSDEVFGQVADSSTFGKPARRVKEYRSCTWLDNGLYLNRHGATSGCARIKNTDRFGFGSVLGKSVDDILDARNALRRDLQSGDVPAACSGCFIADSISSRLNRLLPGKPRRVCEDRRYARPEFDWTDGVIGQVPVDIDVIDSVLALCDGERTTVEISESLSERWGVGPGEGRSRVLPVINELAREQIIAF